MVNQQTQPPTEAGPTIRWGKIDSLCIYYVTEDELNNLENGSPESLYLNFSLFSIATFISFLITLLTTTMSTKAYIFFMIVAVVTCLIGIIFSILWFRNHKSSKTIFKKIRQRVEEEEKKSELAQNNTDPTTTIEDAATSTTSLQEPDEEEVA